MAANKKTTIGEVAKHLNLTERRVQQLTKEGVIPKAGRGEYDLEECSHYYIKYLQENSVSCPSDDAGSYAEQRTRLVKIQADKVEIEVQQLKRFLISVDEVEKDWASHIASCRSRLLAIPSRCASQVAVIDEVTEIERFLRREIYDALNELSNEYSISDSPPEGS